MVRVALTPHWVAMSEAAVPKTWAEARDLVLANLPWILLLVAVERVIEQHFIQAGVALILCAVAFGVAIHWNAFEGFKKRVGRRGLAFVFIAIGAILLAGGIYLLASHPSANTNELQTNLDQTTAQLTAERDARGALDRQLAATRRELQEFQHQAREAAPSPQLSPTGNKQFANKTIRQLRAIYEGRTALQAEPFMADEIGKLIDVEGTVGTIQSGMALLVSAENRDDVVECRFDATWNPKLSTFRQGEKMKVRGTIAPHQGGAQIYLSNCEIRG
jgi:hypothetical protein